MAQCCSWPIDWFSRTSPSHFPIPHHIAIYRRPVYLPSTSSPCASSPLHGSASYPHYVFTILKHNLAGAVTV